MKNLEWIAGLSGVHVCCHRAKYLQVYLVAKDIILFEKWLGGEAERRETQSVGHTNALIWFDRSYYKARIGIQMGKHPLKDTSPKSTS